MTKTLKCDACAKPSRPVRNRLGGRTTCDDCYELEAEYECADRTWGRGPKEELEATEEEAEILRAEARIGSTKP